MQRIEVFAPDGQGAWAKALGEQCGGSRVLEEPIGDQRAVAQRERYGRRRYRQRVGDRRELYLLRQRRLPG